MVTASTVVLLLTAGCCGNVVAFNGRGNVAKPEIMPEVKQLETMMQTLKEEKNMELEHSTQLKAEKTNLEELIQDLEAKHKKDIDDKTDTNEQIQANLEEIKNELNSSMHDYDERIKPLKAQFREVFSASPNVESELTKNVTNLQDMFFKTTQEIKQLHQNISELQKQENDINNRMQNAKARFNKTFSYYGPLQKNADKIFGENAQLEKRHEELSQKLFDVTLQVEKVEEQRQAEEAERWRQQMESLT